MKLQSKTFNWDQGVLYESQPSHPSSSKYRTKQTTAKTQTTNITNQCPPQFHITHIIESLISSLFKLNKGLWLLPFNFIIKQIKITETQGVHESYALASTRWTFVDKVMSLLFNMLSMLVITFLPRSQRLLISWLQSSSAVILEPRKIKSATVSLFICHEVMGPDAMVLVFWMLSFKPTFSLSSFTFI